MTRALPLAAFLLGMAAGLLLAMAVVASSRASQPSPHAEPTAWAPVPTSSPTPTASPSATGTRAAPTGTPGAATPPAHAPRPTGRIGTASERLTGTASWGYGWSGVVTRLPRGTRICVRGPLGSWCGRSVGYGPAAYTRRIADLSRAVFEKVCGDPSAGLCRIVLEVNP